MDWFYALVFHPKLTSNQLLWELALNDNIYDGWKYKNCQATLQICQFYQEPYV